MQVNSIVKPIPNSDLPLPEERKEKSLTIALVFISFYFLLIILYYGLYLKNYFIFSLGGKTKNYSLFLKRKKLLTKRLHTTHPTTINILYFTKRNVPKTMINAKSYK